MKKKMDKVVFNYLFKNLSIEKPDILKLIETEEQVNKIQISLDENTACIIRDWAGEKLQKVGFDGDYELNIDGKHLETIIDLLYI